MGEYLVAAELCRRGLIATTFTGNVPHYDISASNEEGKHVSVQVKASTGVSWQFSDIRRFCEIAFDGERQEVGPLVKCPIRRLVVVFVAIDDEGNDSFYILTWRQLSGLVANHQKTYLAKYNGVCPKKPDSLHCAILEKDLKPYKDKWTTVLKNLV